MKKFLNVSLITIAVFYSLLLMWTVIFARDERRGINVIPF